MKFNNETLRIAVEEWLKDFTAAEQKYGHISNWDTSEVTDMKNLFKSAYKFNEDIGNWNVSKVTNMSEMFSWAESFNQAIGNWDVSNVTDMSKMFYGCNSFNRDLSSWNISNVTDMKKIFHEVEVMDEYFSKWGKNVSEEDFLEIGVVVQDMYFYHGKFEDRSILAWQIACLGVDPPEFEDYESYFWDGFRKIFKNDYVVITFKGSDFEPYRVIDLPKITDSEVRGGSSTTAFITTSIEEALQKVKDMKTISFKEIKGAKGDEVNIKYID